MKGAPLPSAVALATVILMIACARESKELPSGLDRALAVRPYFNAQQFSDWSEPVNLGPLVNSDAVELEVSISRDGLSLYFASNRPGGFGDFDIWVSQRASVDESWGPPQNLGPTINTSAREQGPFVTIDGHRLYFFSDRSGGLGGTDVYVSRRRNKRDNFGWRAPNNLGSGVNSNRNETLPVFFEDDVTGSATLFFTSNRPGGLGATDIYASTLRPDETFDLAVLVQELGSSRRDASLAIRRDGLEMFLASDRPGPSAAPFDLWFATRINASDPWSSPVNLGSVVNTAADEGRAGLSFDGTALYFSSSRPGGFGANDLWVSTRSKLEVPDDDE